MQSALAGGALLVLLGILLGPALGVLDSRALSALAPATAVGIGWIGARFGARLDLRLLRRIPRPILAGAALRAGATFAVIGLAAWALARYVPGGRLAAAWHPARPALVVLAAAAVTVTSRRGAAGLLDSAFGAAAFAVTLALTGGPGWLLLAAAVSGAVALLFLFLSRVDLNTALLVLGVLLVGAGAGYATVRSPFIVCALAAAVIANQSPHLGRRFDGTLREWEQPVYAVLLLNIGALVGLPTLWLAPAALVLGALRFAARRLPPAEPATAPQSAVALALGAGFELVYPTGGAVLAAVVAGAAVTHVALAFRRVPKEVT